MHAPELKGSLSARSLGFAGACGRWPGLSDGTPPLYDVLTFQLTTENGFPVVDFYSEDGKAGAVLEAGTEVEFKVVYAAAGEGANALSSNGWEPLADFMPSDPTSGDETMVVGQMEGFAHITVANSALTSLFRPNSCAHLDDHRRSAV